MANYDGPLDEESIYNLIPIEVVVVKQPMYRSKLPKEKGGQKRATATIGPAKVKVNDPKTEFLRKGEKSSMPEKPTKKFERQEDPKKGAVPKRTERPMVNPPTQKNFVKDNLNDAPHTLPRKVEQAPTKYTEKRDFGQVPGYLEKVKGAISEENAYLQEIEEQARDLQREHVRLLKDDEKQAITAGLQANWDQVHKEYASLPVAIHTLSQKQRKERLELQLATLEKDMRRIAKPCVYVHLES